MQEAGVDLIDIMREEGFLTETRRLTGDGATRSKRMRGLGIIGRCFSSSLKFFYLSTLQYTQKIAFFGNHPRIVSLCATTIVIPNIPSLFLRLWF